MLVPNNTGQASLDSLQICPWNSFYFREILFCVREIFLAYYHYEIGTELELSN